MFRATARDKLIASSPTVGLTVMEGTVDVARPLDGDEIARLLQVCDDAERAWVLTGLGTGVRISESLAVRTEKIDFFGKQLTVADQARAPTPDRRARTDENRKIRTIPLTPSLLEALNRHIKETIPERGGHRQRPALPAAGGGLQRRGVATARFAAIAERAGLTGITWHNLRDTAATTMLRGGLIPA